MNGYLNPGDWLVIVAYLGGIIGLGVWFGRDQRNTRDYFLGSRNIPWWGIGLSIVAAETSALTVIGVPAIAYGSNLMFIQMIVGYVIARVLLAIFMVPHYLKGEIYSPYQLLEQHLGRGPRRLAGAFFLFLETLAAGVRVYVACIPIRLMLGEGVCSLGGLVDPILGAILIFVLLSLVYTYIGGVKAVIWTDAVQFGLFLGGGLFALFYIPTLVDGGWSAAHGAGGRGRQARVAQHELHFLRALQHLDGRPRRHRAGAVHARRRAADRPARPRLRHRGRRPEGAHPERRPHLPALPDLPTRRRYAVGLLSGPPVPDSAP
jgi:SSS family solute:Na+ symporter